MEKIELRIYEIPGIRLPIYNNPLNDSVCLPIQDALYLEIVRVLAKAMSLFP